MEEEKEENIDPADYEGYAAEVLYENKMLKEYAELKERVPTIEETIEGAGFTKALSRAMHIKILNKLKTVPENAFSNKNSRYYKECWMGSQEFGEKEGALSYFFLAKVLFSESIPKDDQILRIIKLYSSSLPVSKSGTA
ncbi:MAG: hypothetical protein ABIA63_03020 [bacterium]